MGKGQAGQPGSRALLGAVPGAWPQGSTLSTWDHSSTFPPCTFLISTLYLSPYSRSCFRCQSFFNPMFRHVQIISRLSGQVTDLPNNYPTGKRHLLDELQPCNFETGIYSGWTLPSSIEVKCSMCTPSCQSKGVPRHLYGVALLCLFQQLAL